MCALVKDKLAESFQPLQLGVTCRAGGAGSFQPLQLGVACHAGDGGGGWAGSFQPLQLGVACRARAEKVTHALRGCIEEHLDG